MKNSCLLLVLTVLAGLVPLAAADTDAYLETIGALDASNMYMTYLALGVTADTFEFGNYNAETTKSIAGEIKGLSQSSRDTLKKIVDKGLARGDDKALLLEMITVHELLISQSAELEKYVDDPKGANDFQSYRKKAWEKIKVILNIKD
jgi:hypothetical protein